MLVLLGFLIVFGSIFGGFMMHGGNINVLIQVSEFLIIGGAGLGAMVIANARALPQLGRDVVSLLKGNPYNKEAYAELLLMLFEFLYKMRKDGPIGVESDVEDPANSEIFSKYPFFLSNTHAVSMLCDTLKVLSTGAIQDHHLDEILDEDINAAYEESAESSHILQTTADAMPGFGIVAAVLGVVITMMHINDGPEKIGQSVAAALVGTFLGILMSYGLFGPLSQATGAVAKSERTYLSCIKAALVTSVRGDSPLSCVEFSRRVIEPVHRPSFAEVEEMTKKARAR